VLLRWLLISVISRLRAHVHACAAGEYLMWVKCDHCESFTRVLAAEEGGRVFGPCGFAVDPASGHFIASYHDGGVSRGLIDPVKGIATAVVHSGPKGRPAMSFQATIPQDDHLRGVSSLVAFSPNDHNEVFVANHFTILTAHGHHADFTDFQRLTHTRHGERVTMANCHIDRNTDYPVHVDDADAVDLNDEGGYCLVCVPGSERLAHSGECKDKGVPLTPMERFYRDQYDGSFHFTNEKAAGAAGGPEVEGEALHDHPELIPHVGTGADQKGGTSADGTVAFRAAPAPLAAVKDSSLPPSIQSEAQPAASVIHSQALGEHIARLPPSARLSFLQIESHTVGVSSSGSEVGAFYSTTGAVSLGVGVAIGVAIGLTVGVVRWRKQREYQTI
jgi:hypothetical protein